MPFKDCAPQAANMKHIPDGNRQLCISSWTCGWRGLLLRRLDSGESEGGQEEARKGELRTYLLPAVTFWWTDTGDFTWGRYSGVKYLWKTAAGWRTGVLRFSRKPGVEGCGRWRFTGRSPSYPSGEAWGVACKWAFQRGQLNDGKGKPPTSPNVGKNHRWEMGALAGANPSCGNGRWRGSV